MQPPAGDNKPRPYEIIGFRIGPKVDSGLKRFHSRHSANHRVNTKAELFREGYREHSVVVSECFATIRVDGSVDQRKEEKTAF
jgi:hypothetical protein